jgi:hypothetical protein
MDSVKSLNRLFDDREGLGHGEGDFDEGNAASGEGLATSIKSRGWSRMTATTPPDFKRFKISCFFDTGCNVLMD